MIDEASTADIPALCDLLLELFTMESDFQPDRAKQAAGLRLILENPKYGKIFVMRRGGKVVGMVNLLNTASLRHGGITLMLEDMIVQRDFRGQGIAKELLAHALRFANSINAIQITLLTDVANQRAINLYQKMGFTHSAASPMRHRF